MLAFVSIYAVFFAWLHVLQRGQYALAPLIASTITFLHPLHVIGTKGTLLVIVSPPSQNVSSPYRHQ